MSDKPTHKLYPGPLVDGRRTWFCRGEHIPVGWSRQLVNRAGFWYGAALGSPIPRRWYLVRPADDITIAQGDWSKTITRNDLRQTLGDEAADKVWDLFTEGAPS